MSSQIEANQIINITENMMDVMLSDANISPEVMRQYFQLLHDELNKARVTSEKAENNARDFEKRLEQRDTEAEKLKSLNNLQRTLIQFQEELKEKADRTIDMGKLTEKINTMFDAVSDCASSHDLEVLRTKLQEYRDQSSNDREVSGKEFEDALATFSEKSNGHHQMLQGARTMLSQESETTRTLLKEGFEGTCTALTNKSDAMCKLVSDKLDSSQETLSQGFGNTHTALSNESDNIRKALSDGLVGSHTALSNESQNIRKALNDGLESTHTEIRNESDNIRKALSGGFEETRKALDSKPNSTEIGATLRAEYQKVHSSIATVANGLDGRGVRRNGETKAAVLKTVNEAAKEISDTFEEGQATNFIRFINLESGMEKLNLTANDTQRVTDEIKNTVAQAEHVGEIQRKVETSNNLFEAYTSPEMRDQRCQSVADAVWEKIKGPIQDISKPLKEQIDDENFDEMVKRMKISFDDLTKDAMDKSRALQEESSNRYKKLGTDLNNLLQASGRQATLMTDLSNKIPDPARPDLTRIEDAVSRSEEVLQKVRTGNEASASQIDEVKKYASDTYNDVHGEDEGNLKPFIKNALLESRESLLGEFETRFQSWMSQNDTPSADEVDDLRAQLQETEEEKISIETKSKEDIKKLNQEMDSLRAQITSLKLENEKYQRLQSGYLPLGDIKDQSRKRPRESSWFNYVHDATTLLQSADLRLLNPQGDNTTKKLTIAKTVRKLLELLERHAHSAVAVAHMANFIREAPKNKWYCLEEVIMSGRWTALEQPAQGDCGRHTKCFQILGSDEENMVFFCSDTSQK